MSDHNAVYINPLTDFLDKKERRDYEKSLKIYRDNYAIAKTERSEGFAEGEAKGRAEERLSVARELKAKGLDKDFIISVTHISESDYNSL